MTDPSLGSRLLSEWRARERLTQQAAGERLGTTGPTISRWEAGLATPELGAAVTIERIAGVPVAAWTIADAAADAPASVPTEGEAA